MNPRSFLSVFLLLVFFGCGGGTSGTGVVSTEISSDASGTCGTVTDASGNRISGAFIESADGLGQTKSDENGNFQLPLAEGERVFVSTGVEMNEVSVIRAGSLARDNVEVHVEIGSCSNEEQGSVVSVQTAKEER